MRARVAEARADCDSVGGVIECAAVGVPAGIGSPFFGSVESVVTQLLFSIPAVKSVEFGDAAWMARMRGSQTNDAMAFDGKRLAIVNNDETVLANDDNRTKSYLAGTTEALITLDGAYFDNCGFTLTVFDQTGVAYSGAYVSSLESANYLTGGTLNMDHLVLPYSIALSWKNDAA